MQQEGVYMNDIMLELLAEGSMTSQAWNSSEISDPIKRLLSYRCGTDNSNGAVLLHGYGASPLSGARSPGSFNSEGSSYSTSSPDCATHHNLPPTSMHTMSSVITTDTQRGGDRIESPEASLNSTNCKNNNSCLPGWWSEMFAPPSSSYNGQSSLVSMQNEDPINTRNDTSCVSHQDLLNENHQNYSTEGLQALLHSRNANKPTDLIFRSNSLPIRMNIEDMQSNYIEEDHRGPLLNPSLGPSFNKSIANNSTLICNQSNVMMNVEGWSTSNRKSSMHEELSTIPMKAWLPSFPYTSNNSNYSSNIVKSEHTFSSIPNISINHNNHIIHHHNNTNNNQSICKPLNIGHGIDTKWTTSIPSGFPLSFNNGKSQQEGQILSSICQQQGGGYRPAFEYMQPLLCSTISPSSHGDGSQNRTHVLKQRRSEEVPTFKRPRLDPIPSYNSVPNKAPPVRKERLGDRIAALQQLVSPFGKTDTASVLLEAIGYIKFLHDQVQVLSTPYMKSSSAPTSQAVEPCKKTWTPPSSSVEENSEECEEEEEEKRQDLRSRGLCLVPLSWTMHLANEPGPDYWSSSLGSHFR